MLKGGERIGGWRLAAGDQDRPACSLAAAGGGGRSPEWRLSLPSLLRLRLEFVLSLLLRTPRPQFDSLPVISHPRQGPHNLSVSFRSPLTYVPM